MNTKRDYRSSDWSLSGTGRGCGFQRVGNYLKEDRGIIVQTRQALQVPIGMVPICALLTLNEPCTLEIVFELP